MNEWHQGCTSFRRQKRCVRPLGHPGDHMDLLGSEPTQQKWENDNQRLLEGPAWAEGRKALGIITNDDLNEYRRKMS